VGEVGGIFQWCFLGYIIDAGGEDLYQVVAIHIKEGIGVGLLILPLVG
jgi:hypothetical protein